MTAPVMIPQGIALPISEEEMRRPLSERAQWVRQRVYGTLVATYLAQRMPIDQAIGLATNQAAHAAYNFEMLFGATMTIDAEIDDGPIPVTVDVSAPPSPKPGAKVSKRSKFTAGSVPAILQPVRAAEPRRRPEAVAAEARDRHSAKDLAGNPVREES
jgi:hypothetical protein